MNTVEDVTTMWIIAGLSGGNQRNGRYNNRNRQQEVDWNHDAFEKANATLDEEREAYREKLRNEVARRLKEQRL